MLRRAVRRRRAAALYEYSILLAAISLTSFLLLGRIGAVVGGFYDWGNQALETGRVNRPGRTIRLNPDLLNAELNPVAGVGLLVTDDPDTPFPAYSLIGTEPDNARFAISGQMLQLTAELPEGDSRQRIRVQAHDGLNTWEDLVDIPVVGKPTCAEGYVLEELLNRCYRFETRSVSQIAARAQCQSDGGDLAIMDSLVENTWIADRTSGRRVWIGLSDEEQEGRFVWPDGTLPMVTRWASGEPNNRYPGPWPENCTLLNWNGRGLWNDYPCTPPPESVYPSAWYYGSVGGFVCEQPPRPRVVIVRQPPSPAPFPPAPIGPEPEIILP